MEVLWPQQPETIRRRAAGTDQASFLKLPKVKRLLGHIILLVWLSSTAVLDLPEIRRLTWPR